MIYALGIIAIALFIIARTLVQLNNNLVKFFEWYANSKNKM